MKNCYAHSAALYDSGNARAIIAEDIVFYLESIPESARVLEVGCGTGRVALELARRGNYVTGIDLSPSMLEVFRQKLSQQPRGAENISLHTMDMRRFDLGQTFDWILFPFRVFQALTSDQDRSDCLDATKRHMTPDSRLVITLFNPKRSTLEAWGRKGILDYEHASGPDGRRIRRYQDQLWHDQVRQIIAVKHTYEIIVNGKVEDIREDHLELGYLYPDQCRRLFMECGLEVVDAFGSYDCRPIDNDAPREQIYVLKKCDRSPL